MEPGGPAMCVLDQAPFDFALSRFDTAIVLRVVARTVYRDHQERLKQFINLLVVQVSAIVPLEEQWRPVSLEQIPQMTGNLFAVRQIRPDQWIELEPHTLRGRRPIGESLLLSIGAAADAMCALLTSRTWYCKP